MNSLNHRGDRTPTAHPLSPNQASNTRFGLYLIELLAKGVQWEFLRMLAGDKTVGYSPSTHIKAQLLKIKVIEHGEFEPVPTQNLNIFFKENKTSSTELASLFCPFSHHHLHSTVDHFATYDTQPRLACL